MESYQIYDPDEIQGINTPPGPGTGRIHPPKAPPPATPAEEEQHQVAFGTGGWRAIIGEGFTLHNVRRLSQALANEITRRGDESAGVLIGYDRRFLSNREPVSCC